jgi:chromate reductase, NAD(P)H dehydrogenase (quinone)
LRQKLIIKTIGAKFTDSTTLLIQSTKSKINKIGEITDSKTAQLLDDLIENFRKNII